MAMADASLSDVRQVPSPRTARRAKRFHGRLKIDATFCPADSRRRLRHRPVGSPHRRHQGRERRSAVRADQLRSPRRSGRQLATNVIVQQVLLRRSRHARAREQRPAAHPPRHPHDRRLGHRRRLLRHARGRRALLPRADLALPAPARRVQLARLVQRRPVPPVRRHRRQVQLALGPARPTTSSSPRTRTSIRKARPASSSASTTTWKTSWSSPAARPCCSSSARGTGTDLSTLRSHREKLAGGGKPSRPAVVHAGLRPDRRGREERRQDPPRRQDAVASRSGIRTSWSSSSASGRKRRRPACLIEKGGYESNFNGEAYSSILFQNANLSVRVTDEFMQAVEKDETWTTHWVTDPKQRRPHLPGPRRAATAWPTAPGTAATPACSTTRRSTTGTPAPTAAASTPAIRAASTCSSTTRPATWPAST